MLLRIWQWGGWSSHNCQTLCWIQLKHASKDLSSTYILYKYETIVYWIWATLRCNNLRLAYNKRYTQNNTKEKLRFAFTIVKDKHSLICQGHSQNTANPRAHHGHTMLPRRNYTDSANFLCQWSKLASLCLLWWSTSTEWGFGCCPLSETDNQICQVKPVSVSKWDCVWFCDSNILPPCPQPYILAW